MIRLIDMTLADLPLFEKWLKKPHVAKWFENPEDWMVEAKQMDSTFAWIHHFVVMFDSVAIGFCQYYACKDSDEVWEGYSALDDVYSIDYFIGDENFLHKGFGTQIVRSLIEKIKKCDNAKTILAQPNAKNLVSRATLLSAGFVFDPKTKILSFEL